MMEISVQLARITAGVVVMLATAAVAAQGDALLVTGSNVNVRAGPSTDAGILVRVGVDEPATEMRRLGQWVEVELPDQDVLGWIHASLVASAPEPGAGPTPETAQATAEPPPAEVAPEVVAALDVRAVKEPATPIPSAASPIADPAGAAPATVVAVATPGADKAPQADPASAAALGQFRSEVENFNNRAVAAAGVDLFTGVAPLGEGGVQVVTTDAWAIMSAPGQQSYLNALFGRWQAASGGTGGLRLEIVDSRGVLMMERSGP